ncbi:MAG TPA: DUF3386 family protein [Pirellulales bacterium]|nr:DUF3386 family protein [Pirellulales bacterium]
MRQTLPKAAFFLAACFVALVTARPATAHFLWVDVVTADGTQTARVMFNEGAEPGGAHLLKKIAQTRAWARLADGSRVELKLAAPAKDDQPAALTAPLPAGTAAVEAECDYGVYTRVPGGVRLQYFAKCGLPGAPDRQGSQRPKMEIVPSRSEGKLAVAVQFDGKPDPTAELTAIDAEGEGSEIKLDADARATIPSAKPGRVALRAKHVQPTGEAGEVAGQKYVQTWYYATLVLAELAPNRPAENAGEETAAGALARARAERAIWHNFPGFTADLTASGEEGELQAKATIDSAGTVTLSGERSSLHDWAEQQLESLVQHRMPDGEVAEGKVTFIDEASPHPLGRMIDLGDEERQSRYRLKDDVIRQVDRRMGPERFTISVLAIERNREEKYLPRAFTMSFWDEKSGELKRTLAFWNTWQRVGDFDLPEQIVEVSADDRGSKTRALTLSDQRLLTGRPTPASKP